MSPDDLSKWIGRTEERGETLALTPTLQLLATLDDTATRLSIGDMLPPLWHWLYFLPDAPLSDIGTDGHPKLGQFLPPLPLTHRMFAGAQCLFHSPLFIGRPTRRMSEVVAIEPKHGRTGPMIFVTVVHSIFQQDRLCVRETQSIVYRRNAGAPSAPGASGPRTQPATDVKASWVREVTASPVLLFRWSALTFNAHRIHYDRRYAIEEEGYPGLVVQGPLVAMLLMNLVRMNEARPVKEFTFRSTAPLFEGDCIRMAGSVIGSRISLRASGNDSADAMQAEVVLA